MVTAKWASMATSQLDRGMSDRGIYSCSYKKFKYYPQANSLTVDKATHLFSTLTIATLKLLSLLIICCTPLTIQ